MQWGHVQGDECLEAECCDMRVIGLLGKWPMCLQSLLLDRPFHGG